MPPLDPLNLDAHLPKVMALLPAALVVVIGAYLINLVLTRGMRLLANRSHLTLDDVGPMRRLLQWLIVTGAVVALLGLFGVNLSGLWAVISTVLAMIAIGFVAVWSVLSNTLCTLIILIVRPFGIGDEVEFAGEAAPVRGRVVDLNFIYTTLQCDDGCDLQIPNNLFFQKVLKRRRNTEPVSLARQLHRRDRARL